MDRYLVILLGGAAGALSRYLAASAIMNRFGGRFPLGTFLINVTGCFAIGAIMTLLSARSNLHPNWRLLIVVGFLGGYTTFSSFAFETFMAEREGMHWIGFLNAAGSVVAGYLAVWLGTLLAATVLKQNS
ncbi:MAG: fluoride efflux transporter CrcB [Acidobacteriota bacterium]|nr:fluoride efflux transporter CrcB [Acidobacteriota bacterium]